MVVMCCSFENVLSDIGCLLGHVQEADDGPRKGRDWDGDENLNRHSAIHLAQEAQYTPENVLQGQTRKTLAQLTRLQAISRIGK